MAGKVGWKQEHRAAAIVHAQWRISTTLVQFTLSLLHMHARTHARTDGRTYQRFYFGTHGSVADLVARAGQLGLEAGVVASVEDGLSNIRDIVRLARRPR